MRTTRYFLVLQGLLLSFAVHASDIFGNECLKKGGGQVCVEPKVGEWLYYVDQRTCANLPTLEDARACALNEFNASGYMHQGKIFGQPCTDAKYTKAPPPWRVVAYMSHYPSVSYNEAPDVPGGLERFNLSYGLWGFNAQATELICVPDAEVAAIDVYRVRYMTCPYGKAVPENNDPRGSTQTAYCTQKFQPPPISCRASDHAGFSTSNPIIPATGEKIKIQTDYLDHSLHSLTFTRIYRSRWGDANATVGLGGHWGHSFGAKLIKTDSESSVSTVQLLIRPLNSFKRHI